MKPTVGISLGCPCGIGPEVVAAALAHPRVARRLVPVVFGDGPTFERLSSLRRLPALAPEQVALGRPGRVAISALDAKDRVPGKPGRPAGVAQLLYVETAIGAAQKGRVDALCTAPVSKEVISRSGAQFVGHTELLAERFGREVLMLMDGPRLKVALATNHLPLRDVPDALDFGRLVAQLKLLSRALRPTLGRKPRIAVLGLNPHAGDGGFLGSEDGEVIAPAVREARRLGIRCEGPFPADGLFARVDTMPFDVVLAMYHDQGLVPAKALDFARTVNVTLGLPVPRTSPDHGTAYDIAGRGRASPENMIAALERAAELARPSRRP